MTALELLTVLCGVAALAAAVVLSLLASRALRAARVEGLPGVVAKRLDSPYEPGRRSRHWLSIDAS